MGAALKGLPALILGLAFADGWSSSGSWRCLAGTLPAQPFSFGCIEGGVAARVCGP